MIKPNIFIKNTPVWCLLALVLSCADPNKEYSPEMKHKTPGIEFTANVDMYRSPSYETYSENPNFSDGITSRNAVEGTVSRGNMPYLYPNTNEGYNNAGDSLRNPVPLTTEVLAEGKDLYVKFCVHCHGPQGNGDGTMIKNKKFPPPPSYTAGMSSGGGLLSELPEGKIFHSITYGRNLMGAHASQLSQTERWKLVHYVQKLQKKGNKEIQGETASAKNE